MNIKELVSVISDADPVSEDLTTALGTNFNETILENSLSGVFIVQDGKYCYINHAAASYTGYKPEKLIGTRADEIILEEDRAFVKRKVREILNGRPSSPYEYRIVKYDNRICWMIGNVTPISFNGKPAILARSLDITERKTAEIKLQEAENFYRAIFETTGTATMIIEEDMTISLMNSGFETLTGYSKTEWEGKKKWADYVLEKDLPWIREYHNLRRIRPDAAPRNYEHDLIDAHGNIRRVMVTVGMIPGTKKSVGSLTDITALKEAEKSLKIKTDNLQELNVALRVLLKQREDDRLALEEKILKNINELALPYIGLIKNGKIDEKSRSYAELLESNLRNIISPFSERLSTKYSRLTPKEITIANFIKEGKTSKEIADIMNVSKGAVDIHRYRLRKKLGLTRKKANLRSHLQSLENELP